MLEEILEKYDLIDEHEIITEITPKGYNVTSQTIELDEVKNYPDKTMITVTGFIDSFSCKIGVFHTILIAQKIICSRTAFIVVYLNNVD